MTPACAAISRDTAVSVSGALQHRQQGLPHQRKPIRPRHAHTHDHHHQQQQQQQQQQDAIGIANLVVGSAIATAEHIPSRHVIKPVKSQVKGWSRSQPKLPGAGDSTVVGQADNGLDLLAVGCLYSHERNTPDRLQPAAAEEVPATSGSKQQQQQYKLEQQELYFGPEHSDDLLSHGSGQEQSAAASDQQQRQHQKLQLDKRQHSMFTTSISPSTAPTQQQRQPRTSAGQGTCEQLLPLMPRCLSLGGGAATVSAQLSSDPKNKQPGRLVKVNSARTLSKQKQRQQQQQQEQDVSSIGLNISSYRTNTSA
eukprot:jgi/Chrzof1/1728/Cz10g18240.t1